MQYSLLLLIHVYVQCDLAIVDTYFHDTFFISPIHVLCFILFYSISMAQAHATYWGKLRKCGLEDMGRFLSDLLHEPNPCVPPSEKGTLVAP